MKFIFRTSIALIVLAIFGAATFLVSVMFVNNTRSGKFLAAAKTWLTESGIAQSSPDSEFGNLLWNGNKCLTVYQIKTVPSMDGKSIRTKMEDSRFKEFEKPGNYMVSNEVYAKKVDGIFNVLTGKRLEENGIPDD